MCNDFRAKRTFFINFFRKNFGGIKKSSNFALANETSHLQNQNGALVQLVRMPACHAGGRWFESCTHRKTRKQSRSRVFCFYPTDLPDQWKFRLRGKILGINYALLPNRQWNQKQKHKKTALEQCGMLRIWRGDCALCVIGNEFPCRQPHNPSATLSRGLSTLHQG